MTGLQIILTLLFVLAGLLVTWGSNKLTKLSQNLYPDENFSGFRPPRRILKRIESEHKDDKESIEKLKNGRRLEIIGLLTFISFLVTFVYGLS